MEYVFVVGGGLSAWALVYTAYEWLAYLLQHCVLLELQTIHYNQADKYENQEHLAQAITVENLLDQLSDYEQRVAIPSKLPGLMGLLVFIGIYTLWCLNLIPDLIEWGLNLGLLGAIIVHSLLLLRRLRKASSKCGQASDKYHETFGRNFGQVVGAKIDMELRKPHSKGFRGKTT